MEKEKKKGPREDVVEREEPKAQKKGEGKGPGDQVKGGKKNPSGREKSQETSLEKKRGGGGNKISEKEARSEGRQCTVLGGENRERYAPKNLAGRSAVGKKGESQKCDAWRKKKSNLCAGTKSVKRVSKKKKGGKGKNPKKIQHVKKHYWGKKGTRKNIK